jgi:hypothetical protein
MKEELAKNILSVIEGYRNEDGISLTTEHVLAWADQFEHDSFFILSELNHIIQKVYVSRERCKQYVEQHLNWLTNKYGYQHFSQFLMDTEFLKLQKEGKSQLAIIGLIEEIIQEKYQVSIDQYVTFPKRNFVYLDDIMATGSTLGKHIVDWLSSSDESGKIIDAVLSDRYRLSINLFCLHTWGKAFQKNRFNKQLNEMLDKKIIWMHNYLVENHAKFSNQAYNNAFPIQTQPIHVQSYLSNLSAEKYESYAYRNENTPVAENFFSSKGNRIKYENIILKKGLHIISMIQDEPKPNVRPLGLINPAYKTFGLGTHFITWRNIPNNCPLVYWWEVPGHNWLPLFPRKVIE